MLATKFEYKDISSPVGILRLVASDRGLAAVMFLQGKDKPSWVDNMQEVPDNSLLKRAEKQLAEYFAGKRRVFDLPLRPQGTVFQMKVWKELQKIPYAETISYGEQARRLGDPKKSRAVGMANGRNPLAIIVPCHRVIGTDGSLTGFGGGLKTKRYLLDLEQKTLKSEKKLAA